MNKHLLPNLQLGNNLGEEGRTREREGERGQGGGRREGEGEKGGGREGKKEREGRRRRGRRGRGKGGSRKYSTTHLWCIKIMQDGWLLSTQT